MVDTSKMNRRPINAIAFWLLTAVWTLPLAYGSPLNPSEALSNKATDTLRHLEANTYAETPFRALTGRSKPHMTAANQMVVTTGAVVVTALVGKAASYTPDKGPHDLWSPRVASNTRSQRNVELLFSSPSTKPKDAAQILSSEFGTSGKELSTPWHPSLPDSSQGALESSTPRLTQTSSLPIPLEEVTPTKSNMITGLTRSKPVTSKKVPMVTTSTIRSPTQNLISSSFRNETTATNKTQIKPTPSSTVPLTKKTAPVTVLTSTEDTSTAVFLSHTVRTATPIEGKHGTSTAVAIIIGGALTAMFVAFVCVIFRKRRQQERNKYNPTWAGPTPFLDGEFQPNVPFGEEDDGGRRKRISVHNLLLGHSSKRQSLLKDADDQVPMEGLGQGSTFCTSQDNEAPPGNGSVLTDEARTLKDIPTQGPENTRPDTINMGEDNLGQDPIKEEAIPPPPTTEVQVIPPAPLLDVDLGPPPGEEASPPAPPALPSDGPIIPPPPPLPS